MIFVRVGLRMLHSYYTCSLHQLTGVEMHCSANHASVATHGGPEKGTILQRLTDFHDIRPVHTAESYE